LPALDDDARLLTPVMYRTLPPLSRLGLFGLATLAMLAPGSVWAELDVVVPAYFYPSANSPWNAMTAAADEVAITAIMNPGNGPGNAKDNDYVAAVNAFRAAGGRVIGYVYTSYGARALTTVTADIDRYAMWYGIDGIFVDEMANTGPAERLNYYKAIYDHVKSINPDWEVMGNPGTATIEPYLTWPTADRLMVFENVSSEYSDYAPSTWNKNYDSSRFVHLIHTEPSATTMQTRLEQSLTKGVGGIYVTHDVLNNPWDTLPIYWQAEVDAIAAINAALLASDFNDDGAVDSVDLARWKASFAQSANADADGDGDADGQDFLAWQRKLGPGSAGPASAFVPEPSALVAIGIGCLGASAAAYRRCHKRS
jgi:hypothetical protein